MFKEKRSVRGSAHALEDVLAPEPLGRSSYWARDYDIHHVMSVCVPGNRWATITDDAPVPLDY
jgi:hypothetical protein